MALTITVNGGGTFTASMEEGPVSFTASLAAVGPAGPAGAAGAGVAVGGTTGQVLAKASATNYDTEWVARNPFNQSLNTDDTPTFQEVRIPSGDNYALLDVYMWRPFSLAHGDFGIEYRGDKVIFANETEQSTALPNGLADGNIVSWDADTSTYLSVPNDARTLFLNGTNKTGTTIAKGKAVYISGATGNHAEITLAIATSETTSARTIGITSEAIANNATGRVIVAGLLENVDTSAFAAGNVLYLSSSSAGGFQTTLPTQPNHGVLLGYVVRANANNGVIEVRVDNYQELGEQSDVLLTSKANGDFLVYESATSLWKNRTLASLDLLTATSAAATYLTQSSASATYQTQAGMSAYLTTSAAAATYYPLTGNPSGFLVSGDLSGYLLSSTAASTYAPIVHTHTASQITDFNTAADARVNALVPAASTTAAGKVELATDAEGRAGTDTARAITAKQLREGLVCAGLFVCNPARATLATSGTGAVANGEGVNGISIAAPTSLAGHGRAVFAVRNARRGAHFAAQINFNEPSIFAARINRLSTNTDAGSVFRMSVGKLGAAANGDIVSSNNAAQIKIEGGGVMQLLVANGTTLTTTNLSNTPANGISYDVAIVMDGTGNAEVFVDGSSVGNSSGAPTANTTVNAGGVLIQFETVNDSTITNTRASYMVSSPYFYTPA